MIDGRRIGEATHQARIGKDGSLTTVVRMHMGAGTAQVNVTYTDVYDKTGRPISDLRVASMPGSQTERVEARYGTKSVSVSTTKGGKTKTVTVPIPKGNIRVASEFWFLRDKPGVGAVDRYQVFDVDTMKWERESVTYRRAGTIKASSGKEFKGHLLSHRLGDFWVDPKGFLLKVVMKMEGAEIILERQ